MCSQLQTFYASPAGSFYPGGNLPRLNVQLTPRLSLPVTKRTTSLFFKNKQVIPQEDLAYYCHTRFNVRPQESNYTQLGNDEIFIKGVGYYSTRNNFLHPFTSPVTQSFNLNLNMAMRPGIPGLQTQNLPALSEEAASATASPARGSEMRNEVLKKLRVPQFIHVWDFWHGRPQASKLALTKLSNEEGIRNIKEMWELYNNFDLARLQEKDTIYMFHHGVRPEWEDPRNLRGGSWTFRVKAANAPEFWKQLSVLASAEILQNAVATQRVSFNDEICGVSYSPRGRLVKISIWNRDGDNTSGIEKLRQCIMDNMPNNLLPEGNMFIYYKKHSDDPEYKAAIEAKNGQ